jgi:hypothetical protein
MGVFTYQLDITYVKVEENFFLNKYESLRRALIRWMAFIADE